MNPKPIDANHAAEKLREVLINWIDQDYCDHQLALAVEDKITEALNALPALDYAPVVHAHWEYCCHFHHVDYYRCSHCERTYSIYDNTKHCQHCGAIMDEDAKQ